MQKHKRIFSLTLFGGLGGLVGFVLSEVAISDDIYASPAEMRHSTGIWFLLAVVGIGSGIVGGKSVADKSVPPTEIIVPTVAALLVGGYLSGYVAQFVYEQMLSETSSPSAPQLPRIVGWFIAGGLAGLAVTIGLKSQKRIQNGVAGGALGGLIGGTLFDPIASAVDNAVGSRLISLVLIATLMAALIALIDNARTHLWIEVVSGEFKGRNIPVIDDRARVGSARTLEVPLLGDRQIQEVHLTITRNPAPSFNCTSGHTVEHNGQSTPSGSISDGDLLTVGSTQLRLSFKAEPGSRPAPPASSERRVASIPEGPRELRGADATPPPPRSRPRLPTKNN